MTNYVFRYTGENRISFIKSIREILGVGLKEAKMIADGCVVGLDALSYRTLYDGLKEVYYNTFSTTVDTRAWAALTVKANTSFTSEVLAIQVYGYYDLKLRNIVKKVQVVAKMDFDCQGGYKLHDEDGTCFYMSELEFKRCLVR